MCVKYLWVHIDIHKPIPMDIIGDMANQFIWECIERYTGGSVSDVSIGGNH